MDTHELSDGFWLTIFGDHADGVVDNTDFQISNAEGKRWSGTAMTVPVIREILHRWQRTGEELGGTHFEMRDLLILATPTLDSLIEVVGELVRTGEYRTALDPLEPPMSADDEP